jgi:hypothetical protein
MKKLLLALLFTAACRADIVNSFFDAGGFCATRPRQSGSLCGKETWTMKSPLLLLVIAASDHADAIYDITYLGNGGAGEGFTAANAVAEPTYVFSRACLTRG